MGLARYYCGKLIRNYLPSNLGKQIQQRRKAIASWRIDRAKKKRVGQYGELSPAELYDGLVAAGVRTGCVLLVHSSFGEFTNFNGTALDALDVLERLVGADGTLIMPAQYVSKNATFNVMRHPTSVGLLSELFRRREGVLRSAHPGQSVCARGPQAQWLVHEHHSHELGCGWKSPFAKLVEVDSQILGLGLPPLWTTFLHVVEDLDLERFPWPMYGTEQRTFKVVGADSTTSEFTIPLRCEKMLARINPRKLAQHVSMQAQNSFNVKGLPCFLANPQPLLEELRELAARGITAYGRAPRRLSSTGVRRAA